MTDEPGNRIPPMKHLNIAQPESERLQRLLREQEHRLDRIGTLVTRIEHTIDSIEHHLWHLRLFMGLIVATVVALAAMVMLYLYG